MNELISTWCAFDAAGEMTCTPLVKMYWALLIGFFGMAIIIWGILSADDQYAPVRDWVISKIKQVGRASLARFREVLK